MSTTTSSTLHVPGATLSYEVRGTGPFLLMIAGGSGGSAGYNGIANLLADQYTVVTYDRRGFAASTPDDPDADVLIETHADDAHHLLAALTTEPAAVFGSSAGALVALDLVARYPTQVHTLIAHEPPAHYLLPDGRASTANILEVYQREGAFGAFRQYVSQMGVTYDKREPEAELPPSTPQNAAANAEALFKYTYPAVRRYRLNTPALLTAPTRITIAGGRDGREFVGYRCAMAVAEQLKTAVIEFPSHHVGYMSHPKAFAERLLTTLDNEA
jgi:pimeloyl-ACP methyl ester carboxylesterase